MTIPEWSWWIWAALALAVVLVVVGLIQGVRKWRARRQKAKEAAPLPNRWPARKLSSVYPRFRRELPQETRRQLWRLPIFVVVGEQGSGTGRLIDANVDWQAQRLKFAPSDTVDNDVKVHLGAREVAVQLSADLLNAEPEEVGPALRRFWHSLPRQKRPTVVMCVDAPTLPSRSEVDLARLGTVVRGKVNLLSAARGGGIDLRIHLARMDEIEGYEDFARLALRLGLNASVVPHGDPGERLEDLLAEFERHLPRALERSADSFAGVARFLEEVRSYLGALAPLVHALTIEEDISEPMRLDGVSFAAANGELQVGRPFAAPVAQARAVRVYQKQGALRAAALFAGLSLASLGAYWGQYRNLDDVHRALNTTRGWQPASMTRGPEEAWVLDPASERRRAKVVEQLFEPLDQSQALARWWPVLAVSYRGVREQESRDLERLFFDPATARDSNGDSDIVPAVSARGPGETGADRRGTGRHRVRGSSNLRRERSRFIHHIDSEYHEGSIVPSEIEVIHASARRLSAALWIHELAGDGARGISAGERRNIRTLTRQILELRPALPAVPLAGTLRSLMRRLDVLHEELEKPDSGEDWSVTLAGLDFDFGGWKQFVVKGWAAQLVRDFIESDRIRARPKLHPFFDDPQSYPEVAVRGAGASPRVAGIYTHGAAVGELAPLLERYATSTWPLPDPARRRLDKFVYEQTRLYVRAYIESWRAFVREIEFEWVAEPDLLKAALRVPPERSIYTQVLRAFETHVRPPEEPSTQLEELWAGLEAFAPLLGANGDSLDLEEYLAALAELADTVPLRTGKVEAVSEERLALLAAADDTPEARAKAWLVVAGIRTPGLQGPFLAPFERVRMMTAGQVRRSATTGLAAQLASVAHTLAKFPFRVDAQEEATVEELEAVLMPGTGAFWTHFDSHVAPLCVRRSDGSWANNPRLGVGVEPADLAAVNALAEFSEQLWDPEGNRRPIAVTVRPLPLASSSPGDPLITQTYLRFGESQVFGFNQMPNAVTVAWAWWEPASAELGIEATHPATRAAERRSIEEFDSPWSLLRILDRANGYSDDGVADWSVPIRSSGPRVGVAFQFASDPRDLFRTL